MLYRKPRQTETKCYQSILTKMKPGECLIKFLEWTGPTGNIALLAYYIVAIILHIIAIAVTILYIFKQRNVLVHKLYVVFFTGSLIVLANYAVASGKVATNQSKTCLSRKISYFFHQIGSFVSTTSLNVIITTHYKELCSITVISTSEDKKKLTRFAAKYAFVTLSISIILVIIPILLNLRMLFLLTVLYEIILNLLSAYNCYRSYRLPLWTMSLNKNMTYLASIKSAEMFILATTILTICPQILNTTISIILGFAFSGVLRSILLWIGRIHVAALLIKPIIYIRLHPNIKEKINFYHRRGQVKPSTEHESKTIVQRIRIK